MPLVISQKRTRLVPFADNQCSCRGYSPDKQKLQNKSANKVLSVSWFNIKAEYLIYSRNREAILHNKLTVQTIMVMLKWAFTSSSFF